MELRSIFTLMVLWAALRSVCGRARNDRGKAVGMNYREFQKKISNRKWSISERAAGIRIYTV